MSDPRDQRITELETQVAAQAAQLAAKDAEIAELRHKVDELTELVLALKEQLNRNSGNSSKPPSSDTPNQRAERRGKGGTGGKRGGQPGSLFSSLPPSTRNKPRVRLTMQRWRTERAYEDLKGELGLDHFEGRRFRGWHHHVSIAHRPPRPRSHHRHLVAQVSCLPSPRSSSALRHSPWPAPTLTQSC